MKLNCRLIILFLFFYFKNLTFYSQNYFKDHFISHNLISFYKSNIVSDNLIDSDEKFSDNGFSIQSKHGLIFFKNFSFQIGTGLNYSISLENLVIPIYLDLKFYYNKFAIQSPYVFLCSGSTLFYNKYKLKDLTLGIGIAFEISDNLEIATELFRNIRDLNNETIFINSENYGIGVGIKF